MVSESIRMGVEEMEFEKVGHITVSGGVTVLRREDTLESVFKRVDDALYEAKTTGRNKMVYKD